MMRTVLAFVFVVVFCACGKPDIGTECVMNGFGKGECSFTNKGNGAGSVCGHVSVTHYNGKGGTESSEFCSGEVEKESTKQVGFNVPGVRDLCSQDRAPGKDWGTVCSFEFVASK